MDLEKMQSTWVQMSKELDQQKILTNEIIMKMAQQKYTSKINRILRSETIGAIICFATIFYVLFNFSKFQSWQSQLSAIILVITLVVMSVGSFYFLEKLKRINLQSENLKITIENYARHKKNNLQFQKLSIIVGFFVLFTASAVFSVLFSNKDMFIDMSWEDMVMPMILGIIIFSLIAYFGSKYYGKALREAQNIIDDLEN